MISKMGFQNTPEPYLTLFWGCLLDKFSFCFSKSCEIYFTGLKRSRLIPQGIQVTSTLSKHWNNSTEEGICCAECVQSRYNSVSINLSRTHFSRTRAIAITTECGVSALKCNWKQSYINGEGGRPAGRLNYSLMGPGRGDPGPQKHFPRGPHVEMTFV